jgi:hypothetical protein
MLEKIFKRMASEQKKKHSNFNGFLLQLSNVFFFFADKNDMIVLSRCADLLKVSCTLQAWLGDLSRIFMFWQNACVCEEIFI